MKLLPILKEKSRVSHHLSSKYFISCIQPLKCKHLNIFILRLKAHYSFKLSSVYLKYPFLLPSLCIKHPYRQSHFHQHYCAIRHLLRQRIPRSAAPPPPFFLTHQTPTARIYFVKTVECLFLFSYAYHCFLSPFGGKPARCCGSFYHSIFYSIFSPV